MRIGSAYRLRLPEKPQRQGACRQDKLLRRIAAQGTHHFGAGAGPPLSRIGQRVVGHLMKSVENLHMLCSLTMMSPKSVRQLVSIHK